MRTAAAVGLILVAATGLVAAQPAIPIDSLEGWSAQPGWLSDSATEYESTFADGAARFTVRTPNSGMKWRYTPQEPLSPIFGAVAIRYRAVAYDTSAGDYAVWLSGSSGGRRVVSPADIVSDGQWHTLTVDLTDAPFEEAVRFIAVAVYADNVPATLEIDWIDFAVASPEGGEVKRISAGPDARQKVPVYDRADEIEQRPDWLDVPADDGHHSVTRDDGTVTFAVDQPGRGMKWTLRFDPPLEREGLRYATLRYRARSIQDFPDYAIWVGSETGGMPQESERLINMPDLLDDGHWHTEVLQLDADFPIAEMAFQVRADAEDAMLQIERLVLSGRRPRFAPDELIEITPQWRAAAIDPADVETVDISALANASARQRLGFWGLSEWLPTGRITATGVPFVVASGDQDVLVTRLGSFDAVEVPLSGSASEILLLMMARLPAQYAMGVSDPVPLRWLREPEAIVFDVRYADGSTVTVFPRHLPDGAHQVGQQLGVYALPAEPGRELAGITLREQMRNAEFAVAGVTVNRGEPLLPDAVFPQCQVVQPQQAPEPTEPELAFAGDSAHIAGEFTSMNVQGAADGSVWLEEIVSTIAGRPVGAGDVLRMEIGDRQLTLSDLKLELPEFRPTGRRGFPESTVRLVARDFPLTVYLHAGFTDRGEPVLGLDLRNTGDEPMEATVHFPAIGPLQISEEIENDWYFFPKRGPALSNRLARLSYPHGGQFKTQFMDLYSTEGSGGLYLRTLDLEGRYGYFTLSRSANGTQMSVVYRHVHLPPGERVTMPDAVVAAHPGDWHEALHRYERWVHSWYQPTVPRKQWFREVFNFRQHRLRMGLLDFGTMQYTFADAIRRDREAFGVLDYLHIFDWSETERWGRVGDYDPWDEIPGPERFREVVAEAQADGVPVGLYLEGYLISKRSRVGMAHGEEWTLLNANGEEYGYFSTEEDPNWSVCPAVDAWQAYMEDVFPRVAEQTGAMGLYIDEFGFGSVGKLCYNEAHDHPVPMPPVQGEREFTRRVREAMPADRVLYTEEAPDPVTCQYQDGAFCYSAISTSDELAPSHLELLRFVLPDFKIFELNFYVPMADGNWNRVKRPFFNGDGWWLQGDPYTSYDEFAREYLRRCFALCHEYVDCFTTNDPEPLVETLQPGVFANRFPGEGRTLWTLYNATYQSVEGAVIAVEHRPGARYYDAWRQREIEPEIRDGRAVLSTLVDPHDLGCIVRIEQR